jgi:hypothetical protein
VTEQIQRDLHPAGTVGDERGRQAARIDVEGGVPGMVQPRRARQPVLADDLGIEMKRRTGLSPGVVGDFRLPSRHSPPPQHSSPCRRS